MTEAHIFEVYPEVEQQIEPLRLVPPQELIEDEVAAVPAEYRTDFNFLDLMDLFEEEFTEAEKEFAKHVLAGETVSVEDLRSDEWTFLSLSNQEFKDFLAALPELKRRIQDTLAEVDIPTLWSRKDRAGKAYYWLLVGKDTAQDSKVRQRQQAAAKPKTIERKAKEQIEEPITGSFEDLWQYHASRIVSVVSMVTRRSEQSVVSSADLLQETATGLLVTFEKHGHTVFNERYIRRIANNKYVDLLRKLNPASRLEARLGKVASGFFESGTSKAEALDAIIAKEPRVERRIVQAVVEATFEGKRPMHRDASFDVLFDQLTEQDTFPAPSDVSTTSSGRSQTEITSEFLEAYLHEDRWTNEKRDRMMQVAKLKFIEGATHQKIAEVIGVEESRISQIINDDILPALRLSMRIYRLGADDAAELLEAGV